MPRKLSGAALSGLLLLAACGGGRTVAEAPSVASPGLCRLAPDDGPPLADRGIGGTGAVADRGIGGTGAPRRIADRGIGGTGIIAVITGFASICLGGVEVALEDGTPITLNGAPVAAGALRAGQLAIVEAAGSGAALDARSVSLRQEVSGPVEAVRTDGRLRVAGQPVQVSRTTFGERRPVVGQWVAVSGLRDADGVVQATRIDPRAPGEVLVRGRAVMVDGRPRIGMLDLPAGQTVQPGGFVTATGRYRGGVLADARVEPDLLAGDPGAAFPSTTRRILLESYATPDPGGLRLGGGPLIPAGAGVAGAMPGRAVVELERQPNGGLRAEALRWQGPAPAGPSPSFMARPSAGGSGAGRPSAQPAPVPRRGVAGGDSPGAPRANSGGPTMRQGGEGAPPPPSGAMPGPPPPGDAGRGPPRPR